MLLNGSGVSTLLVLLLITHLLSVDFPDWRSVSAALRRPALKWCGEEKTRRDTFTVITSTALPRMTSQSKKNDDEQQDISTW